MLILAAISALIGIGMAWVFGKTSNRSAIRRTANLMQAHLLELRLYADEPLLVWRAFRKLMAVNIRFTGLMLRPTLILALPTMLLIVQLDAFYGRTPLPLDEAAIVTAQMKHPIGETPILSAPNEVIVETPALRVTAVRQVSWRIRPLRAVSGNLIVSLAGESLEKRIEAGQGRRYISERRGCLAGLLWRPAEKPLHSSYVDWIEVRYPAATVPLLGVEFHWLVWFALISLVSGVCWMAFI